VSDRIAAIRARLDAWEKQKALGSEGYFDGIGPYMQHFEADIAWLLDELEEWRHHCGCCDCQRLRGGDVIGCICEKCKRHKQESSHA
jgi:hypothetical protein